MTDIRAKVVEFDLYNHPDPEVKFLSIAKIRGKGWQCVVKTTDMKDARYGIYIPIDAEVPTTHPMFAFLDKKGDRKPFRIKTIRLRQQLSQGLLLPAPEDAKLGDDLTEQLGITRWEPTIPKHLAGDMVREPGNFQKYTSIENWKNFPNVFLEGDIVRITEKIHGCLHFRTNITMANGSKKIISQVEVGDEVLGLDKYGNLVPSKVTHKFNNGLTENWMKIKITRNKMGRAGNHYSAVYCTPNHRFWNPTINKFVKASSLKENDEVSLHRSYLEHNYVQEQVLLGKMLGDACLREISDSALIEWSHSSKNIEYSDWTAKCLGELYKISGRSKHKSGYGSDMIRDRTISSLSIKKRFSSFYQDKKIVPEWVFDKITPLSIAFWYMDDGSLGHHPDQEDRANFAVCSFSENDCKILLRCLAKFDIIGQYYQSDNGGEQKHSRIRLNADEAEKLFVLIAPYIPLCMQYKLPERYRGSSGWKPPTQELQYKRIITTQKVISISEFTPIGSVRDKTKHDLETETHNYFANGVLVHNSNARFGFVDDGKIDSMTYFVGTHKTARAKDGTNLYSEVSRNLQVEEKLQPLLKEFKPKQHFIVFGEIYGWNVQDLVYDCGKNQQQFRVFDVLIDHVYQPWSVIEKIAQTLGVKTVPILYRGKFNLAEVLQLRDGKTTLGEQHVREGVVVTAEPEAFHSEVGRKIIKFISDDYLLRKGALDGH